MKPIDIAMSEIKTLKLVILELRANIEKLENQITPIKEDLIERKKKIAEEENEYEKIVKSSWW
jgi:predicted  nucleic acid-binding Zn-ribbon protein